MRLEELSEAEIRVGDFRAWFIKPSGATEFQAVDYDTFTGELVPQVLVYRTTAKVNPDRRAELIARITVGVKEDKEPVVKAKNQIAARDFPGLYEDIDIDSDDLGCIMLDLEPVKVMEYMEGHEDDLFENPKWDQGSVPAENTPHATLLYGLLENGNKWKSKVDKLLKGWSLKTVKIKEVGYFETSDSYAVVAHLEKTPKLIDGHERLTLLPHINTFSEYNPHMTLAYIKKEADVNKWVKILGEQYNGKTIKTKEINYGDLPKDTAQNNAPTSRLEGSLSAVGQEHNSLSPSGLIIAYNALDSDTRDIIKSQELKLTQGFQEIERRIVEASIDRVQKGYFDEAIELLTDSDRKKFVQETKALLNAFYINLYPIFGRQLLAQRATEFGYVVPYSVTSEAQDYIDEMAQMAAESHVETVVQDLLTAAAIVYGALILAAMVTLILGLVAAGNVDILKKLPENPTEDDIRIAIQLGKFKDEEIYRDARRMAREGQGQAEIVKALRDKYTVMSVNRAKTIARTESARVFNQSQFEADRQFLTQSNLMDRAYKKLRSRTGTPCDHCKLLIDMPAIPFMQNFADLGDILKVKETKADGTVKVKSLPINWEPVSAGNVHPNCKCEYVLIIKNSDGSFMNSLDVDPDVNGGKGSGNWGHKGRPGMVGGSSDIDFPGYNLFPKLKSYAQSASKSFKKLQEATDDFETLYYAGPGWDEARRRIESTKAEISTSFRQAFFAHNLTLEYQTIKLAQLEWSEGNGPRQADGHYYDTPTLERIATDEKFAEAVKLHRTMTQAVLHEAGIDTLKLYRGQRLDEPSPKGYVSYADSKAIAGDFGTFIIAKEVPISDVVSHHMIDFDSKYQSESEIIVDQ